MLDCPPVIFCGFRKSSTRMLAYQEKVGATILLELGLVKNCKKLGLVRNRKILGLVRNCKILGLVRNCKKLGLVRNCKKLGLVRNWRDATGLLAVFLGTPASPHLSCGFSWF